MQCVLVNSDPYSLCSSSSLIYGALPTSCCFPPIEFIQRCQEVLGCDRAITSSLGPQGLHP